MNSQNKKHERTIDFFWDNGVWKFPCCNVEIIFPPRDEYPEEELTTILCQYGCGHIILEEYLPNSSNLKLIKTNEHN